MKVITFPSAEHMQDILTKFKKEDVNLNTVIKHLNSLLGQKLPKSDDELKDEIEKLTSVSSELNKIFELDEKYVQEKFLEIFSNLNELNSKIWSVDEKLNYPIYSPDFGQPSLFFIKTSLHNCLKGNDLFNKMVKTSISDLTKPKYH
ncbi:hypothetical protein EXE25_09565 [Acinetobacter bouvetii]|uniref:Uncharacterized protein n=1 Tax=Acinetobacter bouvetii TaxID=202951 RepID=A0A4Q7AWX8_9GAMM|nr:hypothetical protein [Acinetobacter bouvetii]RZG66916.1 hypothetical protein EXE25_09565 [Acinetobacter bouvetii]